MCKFQIILVYTVAKGPHPTPPYCSVLSREIRHIFFEKPKSHSKVFSEMCNNLQTDILRFIIMIFYNENHPNECFITQIRTK